MLCIGAKAKVYKFAFDINYLPTFKRISAQGWI